MKRLSEDSSKEVFKLSKITEQPQVSSGLSGRKDLELSSLWIRALNSLRKTTSIIFYTLTKAIKQNSKQLRYKKSRTRKSKRSKRTNRDRIHRKRLMRARQSNQREVGMSVKRKKRKLINLMYLYTKAKDLGLIIIKIKPHLQSVIATPIGAKLRPKRSLKTDRLQRTKVRSHERKRRLCT